MDTSEKVEELEDTKKADFKAVVEDLVRENSANGDDDDSVAAKETPEPEGDEHKPAEDLEEEEEEKEKKNKPTPVVVSQYFTQANEVDHPVLEDDNKNEQFLDLDESNGFVSEEIIDSIPDHHQNGVSSIVNNNTSCVVTKGVVDDEPAEWALDEKINEEEVSSSVAIAMESKETEESSSSLSSSSSSGGAVVDNLVVPSSGQNVYAETGVRDSNMSEYPVSPGNQPFIAVTPLPLRRTSWMGCCGLFQVLKRSDR